MMDYANISKVVEVRASYANEYLALGWTLLHVGQSQTDGYAEISYSLGWDCDRGEPKEPKSRFPTLD